MNKFKNTKKLVKKLEVGTNQFEKKYKSTGMHWIFKLLIIMLSTFGIIYILCYIYEHEPEPTFISPVSENYTPGNSGHSTASERKATTETVIRKYLEKKGSPLAMEATTFYEEATRNGIDPYLLVSIAGKESSWGKKHCGFNVFGWNRCKTQFESFSEAIATVAGKLATLPAYSEWRQEKTNIELLALTYNPDTPKEWSRNIKRFIEELKEFEFKI